MPEKSVVVFSPSRHSLYTICVTELLCRRGVKVSAVVTRRLLNFRRFSKEFSRDGVRLFRKIWRKLLLREHAYRKSSYETIVDFMRAEKISIRRVDEFQAVRGIPVVYCDDLNDPTVLEVLEERKPSVVVFTGGGLIREEVLKRAGDGVLNCHMGILPEYRGMDVVEWPLLEGHPEKVGMTVHFMDRGVDTGDILTTRPVEVHVGEGISDLRGRFEVPMCQQMVETCVLWLEGHLERRSQQDAAGRQYFIMHPRLGKIASRRIRDVRYLKENSTKV
jgi:folate-dependent phosphoribosylglycinamide formyltransferase PurN